MTGRWLAADRLAPRAGILGASVIAVGSIVTAIAYRGADGGRYNPLNHFVSELGELAQSELAGLFNLSLIIGGVCFAIFMGGFAATRRGRLGMLAGGLGVLAGIGGSFVGVFPLDYGARHVMAASTFFNLGWIAVGLASLDFVVHRDRRFPVQLAIVGLVTVAAFIGFLREVAANTTAGGLLVTPDPRPNLWAMPTLEWLTIAGIVGWVLLVSLAWLRAEAHRVDRATYEAGIA